MKSPRLSSLLRWGAWTGLSDQRAMEMRKRIETLIGLDRFYEIEEETVERRKWGDR